MNRTALVAGFIAGLLIAGYFSCHFGALNDQAVKEQQALVAECRERGGVPSYTTCINGEICQMLHCDFPR